MGQPIKLYVLKSFLERQGATTPEDLMKILKNEVVLKQDKVWEEKPEVLEIFPGALNLDQRATNALYVLAEKYGPQMEGSDRAHYRSIRRYVTSGDYCGIHNCLMEMGEQALADEFLLCYFKQMSLLPEPN